MTTRTTMLLSLLGLALTATVGGYAHADAAPSPQPISIYLDGQQLQPETRPLNIGGTVLVPMRGLFEAQGAELSWNNASKTVTAVKGGTALTYTLGSSTALLNGKTTQLAVPGQLSQGYSMIPLRFVSEALGSEVSWEPASGSVLISSASAYETSVTWGSTCAAPRMPGAVRLAWACCPPEARSMSSVRLMPSGWRCGPQII